MYMIGSPGQDGAAGLVQADDDGSCLWVGAGRCNEACDAVWPGLQVIIKPTSEWRGYQL